MVSFGEAFKICLKEKYASMKGRAPRSEYWFFVLFYYAVVSIPMSIAFSLISNGNSAGNILYSIVNVVSLILLVPTICVAVRRLHDIGKSGWALFVGFIPIVGWIIMLIWFVKAGEPGENKYGPNPLA